MKRKELPLVEFDLLIAFSFAGDGGKGGGGGKETLPSPTLPHSPLNALTGAKRQTALPRRLSEAN